MEVLCYLPTTTISTQKFPIGPNNQRSQSSTSFSKCDNFKNSSRFNKKFGFAITYSLDQKSTLFNLSSSFSTLSFGSPLTRSKSASSAAVPSIASGNQHWMVIMERPPEELQSKHQIINYYVSTLQRVLGSEKEAQSRIYDASCSSPFGFCCDIDGEISCALARLPGVLSVRPDPDYNSVGKDYGSGELQLGSSYGSELLFPKGDAKHWLVRLYKPTIGVVSKAQMVDYYVQIATKVLGNEKDAQMCIYHLSWQSNFGFCCVLDEECARELAGVPGVFSVHPDENFESEHKDYGGDNLLKSTKSLDSPDSTEPTEIQTKKLFITGLSFYTSEKTLRAAFEPFGELVEVKIIMDKISKRSKGYAFIEYTTEEAASAALKEMNGKVINGWMIVVDVAKSKPRYSRARTRPSA
ncbi:Organelle RRM domain-containing protein 1, chloroplastic [Ancistrocladus abbreviatus]